MIKIICKIGYLPALLLILCLAGDRTVSAEAPHLYAVQGARVHTVSGPVLENATILIGNGSIQEIGVGISLPGDVAVIEGKGLDVYPGWIDMANSAGFSADTSVAAAAREAKTRLEAERIYRQALLRSQVNAASMIKAEMPEWKKYALQGITSLLAVPAGEGIQGQSALVNTAIPEDIPQISQIADERRGLYVLKSPVALHISYPERGSFNTYPGSLMGAIAFIRQAFLDAGHYHMQMEHYRKSGGGAARPVYDAALEGLYPALEKTLPVVFQAGSTVEMRRVLAMAREFRLEPIILGGLGSEPITEELKGQKARIIYSLNFPVRPKTLAPDADEPLRTLRERADAPKIPSILDRQGIPYVFASSGLKEPKDLLSNVRRIVKAGLPPEKALRALTLQAATWAGVAGRLGSLEKGKIANLVISEGDLFQEKSKIRYVFIDGRPVLPDPQEPAARERRPRSGQ